MKLSLLTSTMTGHMHIRHEHSMFSHGIAPYLLEAYRRIGTNSRGGIIRCKNKSSMQASICISIPSLVSSLWKMSNLNWITKYKRIAKHLYYGLSVDY